MMISVPHAGTAAEFYSTAFSNRCILHRMKINVYVLVIYLALAAVALTSGLVVIIPASAYAQTSVKDEEYAIYSALADRMSASDKIKRKCMAAASSVLGSFPIQSGERMVGSARS